MRAVNERGAAPSAGLNDVVDEVVRSSTATTGRHEWPPGVGRTHRGRGPSGRIRHQRRQSRLRRTLVVTLLALLVGTALARWREDPSTVLAGGVSQAALGQLADDPDERGTGSGPSPLETSTSPPGDPSSTAPQPVGSPPADPHADSDDPPSQAATPGPSLAAVPASGAGTVSAVEIPAGPVEDEGRPVTYGIDLEDGLPVAAVDFASVVSAALLDPRGWQTQDHVRFIPVSPTDRAAGAHVDIRVTLASPEMTAKLCAPLNTSTQQVSCWNGARAVLNLTRWMRGAATYPDLASYRNYLVSHEVGHGLGHLHSHCPTPGAPAPVMVQQTKDLEGCTPWPWPTAP